MAPLSLYLAALFPLTSHAANIVAFGDSYTTTMFNTEGTQPTAANPLGNPDFPGVSLSGGPSWIGHVLTDHPKAADGTPVLCWNFSNTGAIVNETLEGLDGAIDMVGQMTWFKHMNAELGADDVVMAYFGTNDIKKTMTVQDAMVPQIVGSLFDQLGETYDMGARRFVVFTMDREYFPFPIGSLCAVVSLVIFSAAAHQTIRASVITRSRALSRVGRAAHQTTALHRTPMFSTLPYSLFQPLVKAAVEMWNQALAYKVADFQQQHSDVKIAVVDTFPLFEYIMDNPTKFGAANGHCENLNGRDCLWWDNLHPGQAIQEAVARGAFDALVGVGLYEKP